MIIGGGSGIGQLMAIEYAKRGAVVILWDINEKGNDATADMIKSIPALERPPKVHTYKVDVRLGFYNYK